MLTSEHEIPMPSNRFLYSARDLVLLFVTKTSCLPRARSMAIVSATFGNWCVPDHRTPFVPAPKNKPRSSDMFLPLLGVAPHYGRTGGGRRIVDTHHRSQRGTSVRSPRSWSAMCV